MENLEQRINEAVQEEIRKQVNTPARKVEFSRQERERVDTLIDTAKEGKLFGESVTKR